MLSNTYITCINIHEIWTYDIFWLILLSDKNMLRQTLSYDGDPLFFLILHVVTKNQIFIFVV